MSTNYYDKETDTLIPIAGIGKFPADYGTRAEFEAKKDDLPVGTVFTTTDEFEQGEKDIYSTEEVKTNKVWIDGKPIYRKVIKGVGTSLGLSWNGSVSSGTVPISADIDTVCDFKWYLSDDTLKYYYPIYITQQINSEVRINNNGYVIVNINSPYNYAVFTYTFIFEYTKAN